MTIWMLRIVVVALILLSGLPANAHECWWNGHYWVCPPRMPEWRGQFYEREQMKDDLITEWNKHHWCERHPYRCGGREAR